MESKPFNKEALANELIRRHNIKEFFGDCDKAGFPFLFTMAVANSPEATKYFTETITPQSMGIGLTDDKFADLLNVMNGFTTVLDPNISRASVEGLRNANIAPDGSSYYDDESLRKFFEEQGVAILKGRDGIPDEDFETEIFPDGEDGSGVGPDGGDDAIYQGSAQSIADGSLIPGRPGEQRQGSDIVRKRKPMILKDSTYSLKWGGGPEAERSYEEEFKEIDERHKNILKGNGSFVKRKEEELRKFGNGYGL